MRQAELDLEFTELRRRSRAASATGASRPAISSPAARRAPRRCWPPSPRSIRSASSSPWMRRRTCATSRLQRRRRPAPDRGINAAGAAQADRRDKIRARGQDRLRRQRHRPLVRHHPRPRRVRQPDGTLTPGMFGRIQMPPAAGRGAAGAGRRDRHRAGAQVRLRGRRRECRHAEVRDARSASSTACAWSRQGSSADDTRHRQRPDARAARRQGDAAAGRGRRRRPRRHPSDRTN